MNCKFGLLLLVGAFVLKAGAAPINLDGYYFPTNSPPQVTLAWDPYPIAGATFNVYWGVGSRAYTNVVTGVTANSVVLQLSQPGVKYYFAATATVDALESVFSNEATYTPTNPPAPPNLGPIVTLVVRYKNNLEDFNWVDTGMNWSIDPLGLTNQYFSLGMVASYPTPKPQVIRLTLPPIPGR